MKIQIIDSNHIMLVASPAEVTEYNNHTRIFVDNKDSFVCNSEPSAKAFIIQRPENGTLFNVSLDISYSPFSTGELLIVYLELADSTYPFVIPCYNNEALMDLVAQKSGVLTMSCDCLKDVEYVTPIVMYYGFKLALALLDIQTAIRYWNRLIGINNVMQNRNCNGC